MRPKPTDQVRCQRTVPKCIWIDLGAADGNTLKAAVSNFSAKVLE